MLILFDIDGTILRTQGVGLKAMERAGREVVVPHFSLEGVPSAGRLDPLIYRDGAAKAKVDDPDKYHDRFRERYGVELNAMFEGGSPVTIMPGINELLEALGGVDGVTIALLTGNYPETGRMKIAAGGIDPDQFVFGAWGIDGPSRRDLTPVAMQRYRERTGVAIERERVIIIGDTPHDIDCARAHGCRALAVATGGSTMQELQSHAPDLLMENLADTESVLRWLLDGAAVSRR